MSEKFMKLLKFKVVNLVNAHGPIIDIIHSMTAYEDVEEIIDCCINYFKREGKRTMNEEYPKYPIHPCPKPTPLFNRFIEELDYPLLDLVRAQRDKDEIHVLTPNGKVFRVR